jgi:hypothetical protein
MSDIDSRVRDLDIDGVRDHIVWANTAAVYGFEPRAG